ncbi:MAG: CoA transferase subunit A [Candidatus Saccharibacteria bacterium]|nr:CoA transferase subunit A [Microbacteriaceae bacterium]
MTKQCSSAREAIHDVIHDGSTIAVGGFGLSGNPSDLIEAVRESGARDLTIVSNNMGVDGQGLGILLENHQVTRVLASYVGENKLFAAQFLNGELEVEFVPQGTLAERLRAGGAGIAGFYTKTGVGTPIAEGKELHEFDGELFVLERGIVTDLALVRAHRADRAGNLVYRFAARNFNPNVATAGRVTIVEAEEISEGYLDPEVIVTPGIFVQRLVLATTRVKAIEQRTVRPRPTVEV